MKLQHEPTETFLSSLALNEVVIKSDSGITFSVGLMQVWYTGPLTGQVYLYDCPCQRRSTASIYCIRSLQMRVNYIILLAYSQQPTLGIHLQFSCPGINLNLHPQELLTHIFFQINSYSLGACYCKLHLGLGCRFILITGMLIGVAFGNKGPENVNMNICI